MVVFNRVGFTYSVTLRSGQNVIVPADNHPHEVPDEVAELHLDEIFQVLVPPKPKAIPQPIITQPQIIEIDLSPAPTINEQPLTQSTPPIIVEPVLPPPVTPLKGKKITKDKRKQLKPKLINGSAIQYREIPEIVNDITTQVAISSENAAIKAKALVDKRKLKDNPINSEPITITQPIETLVNDTEPPIQETINKLNETTNIINNLKEINETNTKIINTNETIPEQAKTLTVDSEAIVNLMMQLPINPEPL